VEVWRVHGDGDGAGVVARIVVRQPLRRRQDVTVRRDPRVFQLMVRVTLAPAAIPPIVCVPTVMPPAVPSVNTTSKLVLTSTPPRFCTVTTTGAVSPCVTWAVGAVMAVTRDRPAGDFHSDRGRPLVVGAVVIRKGLGRTSV